MADPLERYAWKRQTYTVFTDSTGRLRWWCDTCGRTTNDRRRHDSACKYRSRDTTRLKPAYAPNPWNTKGQ